MTKYECFNENLKMLEDKWNITTIHEIVKETAGQKRCYLTICVKSKKSRLTNKENLLQNGMNA